MYACISNIKNIIVSDVIILTPIIIIALVLTVSIWLLVILKLSHPLLPSDEDELRTIADLIVLLK